MRRGHSGISGWRNDNPRHFRPRSGGTPHFRPPRTYGLMDTPRFPPPSSRPMRGMTYNMHSGPIDDNPGPEQHERNNYRGSRPHTPGRYQPRCQYPQKQIFPLLQRLRHGEGTDHNQYGNHNYYENQTPQCHINNMGDVDHRQTPKLPHNQGNYNQRPSPWIIPPFEERSYNKPHSHDAEYNRMPTSDYTGHRPPASDHYGGSAGSAIDNSNTFSRSVDDTVNIVRKRLLSRESQHSSDTPLPSLVESENKSRETIDSYSNVRQEHTPKKKIQKQRNVKSNCDQIKNKIVHQLFMMDKDKIHKLMDNPSSSTKFEYAISSLVTESQNSFNRHLRSVAEKSLCSSSTDFINNENNTIYEDTFMKEMQGLLDPQDTVLLEDIKPMVLAELNKVLQLDDFEQRYEADDQAPYPSRDEEYDSYNYENYPANESCNSYEDLNAFYDPNTEQENYDKPATQLYRNESKTDHGIVKNEFDTSHLFGRREKRPSFDYNQRRLSTEQQRRRDRNSVDNMAEDKFKRSATPVVPLFDSNVDQLSDEEDPFAELDRQYHVAVDHNFIGTDDVGSPQSINKMCPSPVSGSNVTDLQTPQESPFKVTPEKNPSKLTPELKTPEKISLHIKKEVCSETKSLYIKQEIDNQLQSIAKSPLKFSSSFNSKQKNELEHTQPKKTNSIEQLYCSEAMVDDSSMPKTAVDNKEISALNATVKQNKLPESKSTEDTDKSQSSSSVTKSSTAPSSRKRSVDQRPAHRKEKRKKSESSVLESNKQILNKNIIINVNDCASKTSEKCDTPKSVFNLFFAKEKSAKEAPKEVKKVESDDKGYSDKYVKRKEQRTKSKEKETEVKKKHNSSLSSHSNVSPTSSNVSGQTPNKTDGLTKLKPIDMFVDSKRKSNIHHAHRNTAPTPSPNKAVAETKFKPLITSRKVSRRHIATQVIRKCVSKETQTSESKFSLTNIHQNEQRKLVTTAVQTDPVSFKTNLKSTDAFERMKEIDLEIQALLQEKFKLYNSLESKETCSSTMQSLGMAVFPLDDKKQTETSGNDLSEDAIVDNFTNIPVEELEQIAFESVTNEESDIICNTKPIRRQKVVRQDTQSPVSPATSTTSTRSKKKVKAPNISLIEQIITDDRPLEDIISLDDLEVPLPKSKKKPTRPKPKKKAPSKAKANKSTSKLLNYDIKECCVVLTREDFSKYLTPKVEESKVIEISCESGSLSETVVSAPSPSVTKEESIEETVVNDIQFDMLDVSEDIIIGDSVEVKSSEEKDASEMSIVISEEIILDNSQSSIEDAGADPPSDENVCKTYDYSADESLRRDSVTVTGHADAVLAIECVENDFIAACLDGNVYHFSGEGQLLNTLRGSNLAVTCVTIVHEKYGTTVYTGSLDSRIRYYDLETGLEKGPECNVLSPIQSMDRAWDTIFVGTRTGFVLQFECKNNMLIPVSTVKFSEQSILALRAMKEGPRKVLLVASRSEPVTIKDAQTGLLLRTLDGPKMTVYTLLFDEGKVYCGTSSHQIHVFDYVSGSHVGLHEGGKGAVCLRATGGLLFAGCYDGCVYIYREGEAKPLAQLRGPGLMLLSLAVIGSKIIAGYKDRSLYIWKIPTSILNEMILS